jgi:hypothetical protein
VLTSNISVCIGTASLKSMIVLNKHVVGGAANAAVKLIGIIL